MIRTSLKAARFQTKVLVPIIVVMALLLGATMYVVNHHLTAQFKDDAAKSLVRADALLNKSQGMRSKGLLARFRNLAKEPKYRAACGTKDTKTLEAFFRDELIQHGEDEAVLGDMIQYIAVEGETIASASRDLSIRPSEISKASQLVVQRSLRDDSPGVDTVRVGNQLFDIVAVPMRMNVNEGVVGALTFCTRIGQAEAEYFSEITGSSIVLVADDVVVGSSMKRRDDLFQQCVTLFGNTPTFSSAKRPHVGLPMRDIVLAEEHLLGVVGRFDSMSGDPKLGYVLLYSFEEPLRALQATQRTLITVGLFGILIGVLVVCGLVRNATKPLRELRDSAEAVGRGDFTHRVNVTSQDECGELANVFNRMTENLQASRQELEAAVLRLQNTQAQLVQSEKLSAIGEFVAGVTHELNNPLTSLLGFSELLQQTNVDERQKRFVDRIANSARRCQKIVQSLLSFARQHSPERKVTNLNDLVDAVVEIMVYEMRTSNIEVVKQFDSALPDVLADPHQVQQVFLNLVNNARQAMEGHQSSGLLRIRTESLYDRVRVVFQDNGPGISDENLKKIFDPFFTTKEAGKGTGLGLSLSYGIIQEHGGTIRVESKLGAGATFIIELPVYVGNGEAVRKDAAVPAQPGAPQGGGKHVLVIDDEEAILDFVAEVLSADGFKVDTARDGESALQQLRQKQYDLALCDWKMPGLNGQRLYERVRTEDPSAARRFVFMTGDVINEQAEAFLKLHRRHCLSKPFSVAEFRSALSGLTPAT